MPNSKTKSRPLAEPRSGRYAGCESAAGEVFGCIPHARGAYRKPRYGYHPSRRRCPIRCARAFLNEVEKVGGGGQWIFSLRI